MRVLIFTFLTTLSTIIYSNQGKLMKELNIIPRPESIKMNNGTTEINTIQTIALMNNLKERGSKGLHLGLGIKNDPAYTFYIKYGMIELKRNSDTIYMGISFE